MAYVIATSVTVNYSNEFNSDAVKIDWRLVFTALGRDTDILFIYTFALL